MEELSPLHLILVLVILVFLASVLIPIARILQRTGHSGWWCLLYFVPLLNLVGLWVFAYVRWPTLDNSTR